MFMQYRLSSLVKVMTLLIKAQTSAIRLLAHHKPLQTMRVVCAYAHYSTFVIISSFISEVVIQRRLS